MHVLVSSSVGVMVSPRTESPKVKKGLVPSSIQYTREPRLRGPDSRCYVLFVRFNDAESSRVFPTVARSKRVAENYKFAVRDELREYCTSDCALSREGCLKLRARFLLTTKWDPFRYVSLPTLLYVFIFISLYLEYRIIAVFENFDANQKYSKECIAWLHRWGFSQVRTGQSPTSQRDLHHSKHHPLWQSRGYSYRVPVSRLLLSRLLIVLPRSRHIQRAGGWWDG